MDGMFAVCLSLVVMGLSTEESEWEHSKCICLLYLRPLDCKHPRGFSFPISGDCGACWVIIETAFNSP